VGTDSSVAITAGTGTPIDAFLLAGGDYQQVVREAPATAVAAPTSWTISTTAAPSQIAADVSRRALIMWNTSPTATVYLRYDGTAPTTAAGGYHDQLPPSSRLVVEKELATLAISFIGSTSNGSVNIATATAA
jgi:hypothetical protein